MGAYKNPSVIWWHCHNFVAFRALAFKPLIWHCVLYPSISILLSGLSTTWPSLQVNVFAEETKFLTFHSSIGNSYNDGISCLCDNWFMLSSLITSTSRKLFHNFHTLLPYISEWHWSWTLGIIQKCKWQWQTKVPKRWVFSNSPFQLCDLASIATSWSAYGADIWNFQFAHTADLRNPSGDLQILCFARVKSCTKKSRWVDGFFTKLDWMPLLPIPNFVFTGSIFLAELCSGKNLKITSLSMNSSWGPYLNQIKKA